jgi:hypothetical protein
MRERRSLKPKKFGFESHYPVPNPSENCKEPNVTGGETALMMSQKLPRICMKHKEMLIASAMSSGFHTGAVKCRRCHLKNGNPQAPRAEQKATSLHHIEVVL